MNEFDIIDLIYERVQAADVGMTIYKDRSRTGEIENHIVIGHLEYHELQWKNVLPVNVNIFIKLSPQSGMLSRQGRKLMRETKEKIRTELLKIKPEQGKYRSIEINGSVRITGAKENFDCTNIRVIINTEKNIEDYGR